MKIILICSFILLTADITWSQNSVKKKRFLKKNNLELLVPVDFYEFQPKESLLLPYHYSLMHKTDTFEIRYSIFPLKESMKAFNKTLKNSEQKMVHPNFVWENHYQKLLTSISGIDTSKLPKSRVFSKEAMKDEFNADAGSITFLTTESNDFSGEYTFCLLMVLHKNFESDVYISFLGNNRETITSRALEAFHAIQFSKK